MDVAIELSGSYRALHEAVRCVVVDGRVIASGFYQGGGEHLRLGEEFHHNRVQIVASQIGGTPIALGARWNQPRLVSVFMEQIASGAVDVTPLISYVVEEAQCPPALHAPHEVSRDLREALLLIQGITILVVAQAVEVDGLAAGCFQIITDAPQHLPAESLPLKFPGNRQYIDERQCGG